MRYRPLSTGVAVAATLLCAAAVGLSAWVEARVPGSESSTLGGVYGVVCAALGALLVHLRPRNAIGWLLVLTGVLQGLSVGSNAYGSYGVKFAEPGWPFAAVVAQAGSMVWLPSLVLPATVLVAVYPSGRLPAHWWRWPVGAVSAGLLVGTVLSSLTQGAYDDIASGPAPVVLPDAWWVTAAAVVAGAAVLAGAATIWGATVVRLVRARSPERQQLAWLVCVVLPLMVMTFLVPAPEWVFALFAVMLPGSIVVGVVRYRLLGIVVSRALVYATLTAVVVVAYFAVSATVAAALGRSLSPVPGAVTATLIAVALSPARTRLQSATDRLVYGRRRDPVAAVTELGDRVATAEEAELLPAVLDTVTAGLRAPGAWVTAPGEPTGPEAGTVAVPLRVGGRDVGTLHVAERHPGEPFTTGDRRLLAALAPQVAVVVRALELAGSLERERNRVLTATHAERDRIRRDLHDGLGPSLAGIGLGVQAVQAHLGEDGSPAGGVLARLKDEVDAAVGEVRRILDGLRPAPLDDVGFVAAVRRHADALAPVVPVRVTAEDLPPLPPDVETAAYRIAQEALTNVARHSGARSAEVGLRARDGRLEVAVVDDGRGFEPGTEDDLRPYGVGLDSMRTRATAVGGELTVTSGPDGTRVVAGLPLEVGT